MTRSAINVTLKSGELGRALASLRNNMDDMQQPLEDIAADIRANVDLGFRTESDPYGTAWAPLSPATLRARMRRGARGGSGGGASPGALQALTQAKILQDTGRLKASFTYKATKKQAIVGTNVAYARAHQYGVPGRNIPARPMLPNRGLPQEWSSSALDSILRYLSN